MIICLTKIKEASIHQAQVQWNVSYQNMSGLNPVRNYEYSISEV